MKFHTLLRLPVLSLLVIPVAVSGADASRGCAQVLDDAPRLACYDAVFGKPARAAGSTPASAPAALPAAAPVAPSAVVQPAPRAAGVPVAAVAGPAAPVPAVPAPQAQATKEAKPGKVTVKVASVRNMLDGRYELKLENGETWMQLETDRQFEARAGDTVTLRPAAMGSFMLDSKDGIRIRVKLVQ